MASVDWQEQKSRITQEFASAYEAGDAPDVRAYLNRVDEAHRSELFQSLLSLEISARRSHGEQPTLADYRGRFAEFVVSSRLFDTVEGRHDRTAKVPDRIESFRVDQLVGQGGFGLVFRGFDTNLERQVAIKVPHREFVSEGHHLQNYLDEARAVAKLEHPNIVPIYHVGSTPEYPFYLVSRFVAGGTLLDVMQDDGMRCVALANVVSTIADAVHHAHTQGLIHRDIKPSNILIDESHEPHLIDFGLALRDADVGQGEAVFTGTVPYMSPEQARGEGHRLTGQSDIFSLGAVLYEALTGRRPFHGETKLETLELIREVEPRPLRQLDGSIPQELERICTKALAKRTSERYATALDLAVDLRRFVYAHESGQGVPERLGGAALAGSKRQVPKIVPKGLRSFDRYDAEFFLRLLPGPRDHLGLPDGVRFWKTKIESRLPDETPPVGLIYGPSGCGKSSLVKAGILPNLDRKQVQPVYVEATADQTEGRILVALRRLIPEVPETTGLRDLVASLRRGEWRLPYKVLIVVDQFEQWLHAHREDTRSELIAALRHCDGVNVQCIVMVRDDFWMATTQFARSLEIRLVQGYNSNSVDLFTKRHAREVLVAFGRAYGVICGDETSEQSKFVDRVIDGLAVDGRVICVRLSLFAEMMKNRAWDVKTLDAVGGTDGVGLTFLEETFSAATAPPIHRVHQKSARRVLHALLPETGTPLKGHMRSKAELREISGYGQRPREFSELIDILDRNLRLITPTERIGEQPAEPEKQDRSTQYYQLTHDYLVPAMQEWLTLKQRETRRGRMEVLLRERAEMWKAKPENRMLPSAWEYVSIRALCDATKWQPNERRLMRRAGQFHFRSLLVAATVIVVVVLAGSSIYGRKQAKTLIAGLMRAKPEKVLEVKDQLRPYRRWANADLRAYANVKAKTPEDRLQRLHARLVAIDYDSRYANDVADSLLSAPLDYIAPITRTLQGYQDMVTPMLWDVFEGDSEPPDRRFRAGLALVGLATNSSRWEDHHDRFLVERLIATNPEHQARVRDLLRPIRNRLLHHVQTEFARAGTSDSQQIATANGLVDFLADKPARLAAWLCRATPRQFSIVFDPLEQERLAGIDEVWRRVAAKGSIEFVPRTPEQLAKQQANAAVALLRRGQWRSALDVFNVTQGADSISQFVARSVPCGLQLDALLTTTLAVDRDRSGLVGRQRSAADRLLFCLLSTLGQYPASELPPAQKTIWFDRIASWYAEDPNSSIHSVCGWLLRTWGQHDIATAIDQREVAYEPGRQWFSIRVPLNEHESTYMTFIVFEPGVFRLGSEKETDFNRDFDERSHECEVTRRFAVLDREVTRREMEAAGLLQEKYGKSYPTAAHAVGGVNWYRAVRYCRWLTSRADWLQNQQAVAAPETLSEDEFPMDGDSADEVAVRNWPVDFDMAGFRLPTEAEWEIACRAGTDSPHSFGADDTLLSLFAWTKENSGGTSHPPRERLPNFRGLFDMHGNVWEWCFDWYGPYTEELEINPIGAKEGTVRVVRGGSWYHPSGISRSANRLRFAPVNEDGDVGFRIVMTLPTE